MQPSMLLQLLQLEGNEWPLQYSKDTHLLLPYKLHKQGYLLPEVWFIRSGSARQRLDIRLMPVNVYHPQTVKQKNALWVSECLYAVCRCIVNRFYWLSVTLDHNGV